MPRWISIDFPHKPEDWSQLGSSATTIFSAGLLSSPSRSLTWDRAYEMWTTLFKQHPELCHHKTYSRVIAWFNTHKQTLLRSSWSDKNIWFNQSIWPDITPKQYANLVETWVIEDVRCGWGQWHIAYSNASLSPSNFFELWDDILSRNKVLGYGELISLKEYCAFRSWYEDQTSPPSNAWKLLARAASSKETIYLVQSKKSLMQFLQHPDAQLVSDLSMEKYAKVLSSFGLSIWSVQLNGLFKKNNFFDIDYVLDCADANNVSLLDILKFLRDEVTLSLPESENSLTWSISSIISIKKIFQKGAETLSLDHRIQYFSLYIDYLQQVGHTSQWHKESPWLETRQWFHELQENVDALKDIAIMTVGPCVTISTEWGVKHAQLDYDKYYEHTNILRHGFIPSVSLIEEISLPALDLY